MFPKEKGKIMAELEAVIEKRLIVSYAVVSRSGHIGRISGQKSSFGTTLNTF